MTRTAVPGDRAVSSARPPNGRTRVAAASGGQCECLHTVCLSYYLLLFYWVFMEVVPASEVHALSCQQAFCFLDKMVNLTARGGGVLRGSELGDMPASMAGHRKRGEPVNC